MTPSPAALDLSGSVGDAFELMASARCRHIPVLHRGMLEGMVSDRDLLAHMPPPSRERPPAAQGAFARQPIATVMTRGPMSVHIDQPVAAAIAVMVAEGVGALPVVDGAGLLVGIVTLVDVARGCLALLQPPETATHSREP